MKNKVVVVGASGLIGLAAIEAFLAAGWDVIGISRRKPELPSGRDFRFIPVDLRDEKTARQALSPLADVTHVAYTALYENADDLVSGWSNAEQIKVNNAIDAMHATRAAVEEGFCLVAGSRYCGPSRSSAG